MHALLRGATIVLVHEFHKPPYGGGNQFLMALDREFRRQGVTVRHNRVGPATQAILFNSFNFNFERLRILKRRSSARLVHRVDGPIGAYRGSSEEIDRKIWKINQEIADATVFQSRYSLEKHVEMGLMFQNPLVIPNAADPMIFHSLGHISLPKPGEPVKLISVSWSDNPRKGLATYQYLDKTMDNEKYEYTFVGRCQAAFHNIRMISPVPSAELAALLRAHHIFITASEKDPCSNALTEALSCGLPAVYLRSGGHPEMVREGGVGFNEQYNVWPSVETVVSRYTDFQSRIVVPTIESVAHQYREVLLGAVSQ